MNSSYPVKASFSKKERLVGKKNIENLFRNGGRFSLSFFKVFFLWNSTNSNSRILISVPKKRIKSAVSRNHIKRRIKEVYRLNKGILCSFSSSSKLDIAFIYTQGKVAPYRHIEREVIKAISHLRLLASHKKQDS